MSTLELTFQNLETPCGTSANIAIHAFEKKYVIHLPLQHRGGYIVVVQLTTFDEENAISRQTQQAMATNAWWSKIHLTY